eukprot:gnl/Chilomastix_cuspidata/636.p1 GENE.gnl/Chilomastix_cuspidata/636~~gnl/Chilomastix_cuspidata/636.p1  ORF type:complete len:485 (-),score=129.00 gnl/Chilomastix_cuspidata/636:81-1535(-)
MLLLVLVLALGFCTDPVFPVPTSDTTALIYTLTMDGMNAMVTTGVDEMVSGVMSIEFDDISDTAETAIGTIEYSLTNMAIVDFDIVNISISTVPEDNTLILTLDNNSLSITFDYSYQLLSWPYTSEEGTGVIDTSGIVMEIAGSVSYNPDNGALVVAVEYLTTSITYLSIELDGGVLALIIDVLVDLLDDSLTEIVEALITEELLAMFDDWVDDELSPSVSCYQGICEDYRLSASLVVSDSFISQSFGGTYYSSVEPDTYVEPDNFNTLPNTIDMHLMQVFMGPAYFSSYFASLHVNGNFTDVTSDSIAASDIATALPEFAAAFPDEDAVLTFSILEAPETEILYSALQVNFHTSLSIAAASDPSAAVAVLDLMSVTAGEVDFMCYHGDDSSIVQEQGRLTVVLSDYETDVEVSSSAIGDIQITDALCEWADAQFFAVAVGQAWQPLLDSIGMNFVELDSVAYTDRSITYSPEYVSVNVNMELV